MGAPPHRRALDALALVALVAAAGCDPDAGGGPAPPGSPSGASPNASILPGPRADETTPGDAGSEERDAGPRGMMVGSGGRFASAEPVPPATLRPDRPLPLDPLARADLSGVTLQMAVRWRDVAPPPKAPEVHADGVARAAAVTRLTWTADLSEEGRMRVALDSRAFPLPPRTELRASEDRLGHVLLWPDGDRYRPVAPGALRALLGERRLDVTPLAPGTILKDVKTKAPKLDGLPEGVSAREVQIESSLGTLTLEMVTAADAGRGAITLCRFFVEIAGIEPLSPACRSGEVPLIARFGWRNGGGFDIETLTWARRTDLPPGDMAVPPPPAKYSAEGLPEVPFGVFLTKSDLAAFRTKPVAAARADDAPGEGFHAVNDTELLLYLLLDGVPVVAVPPHESRYLIGTLPGTYVAQWRSFMGEQIEPAAPHALPARLHVGTRPPSGENDAGP